MPPRVTELRLQMLRVIAHLTRTSGGPPSATELARTMQRADSTISRHADALFELGLLQRDGKHGRLHLTADGLNAIGAGIPIYGEIAAGPPILAEQVPDERTPSVDALLGVREGDFFLKVKGHSMIGIGVMDGDYVLVRPAQEVLDGEVAVVTFPGEQTGTLKRFTRWFDEVILESENPNMGNMQFRADQVQVQGRMVAKVGLAVPRSSRRKGKP